MTPQNVSKKRIVLLTDCLADLAGGAEKQIFELAKGLDKNLYDVYVVSLETWGQASRELIESTGSHFHVFKVVRIYGLSGLIQGLRFKQFLKVNKIDILLTYHFSSDIWGTFWGHLAGVKKIISNRRDMGFWRNSLHVAAYKLINRWVNTIVVVSTSIKEMVVEKEAVKPERIEVIYNGVQLPDRYSQNLDDLRQELGLKVSDIVLMHVANLKPIKGHKYLLEAFSDIVKQNASVRLVLIGKDELNGQLHQMAQELNVLDMVLFLGKRDDVSDLLKIADICVLPSLSEGMSNSILEYMAAGKPVVATKVGGNPELIKDGVNGFLVDKEDTKGLKEALLNLINDQHKRVNMGQTGFELVKTEFSMSTMIKRYEHLFSGIKVLHLISSGGLFGAERVIINLASKSKNTVSFVGALNNKHNPHLELIEEAKQVGLNTIVFDSNGQFDMKTIISIRNFIVTNKIDVLHTHNYKADILGFCAVKGTKAKWMATNHVWHSTDKKLKFYETIDAQVLKFASKVVGVSEEIKDDLLKKKFKEDRLDVVDNGITVEKFNLPMPTQEWRLSMGIKPDDIVVLIVGRLAKEKGHDVFLKAAIEVYKSFKEVKFVIVGDGPLKNHLTKEIKRLDLSKYVILAGLRTDLPCIYAASDLMVNSSYIEGLPMTILEAMASHLPIIATNVGATGEAIKNKENGILLKAGDDKALASAILELINDPKKREYFANQAYKDVCERFSDNRMAKRYEEIYKGL